MGYAGVLGFIKTQKYPLLFWSGLALGGTILIRITCILHVFTVGCFLLGCLLYQTKNIQKIIKDISIWLVGLVPRFPTVILAASIMLLAFLSFTCGLILDSVARGRRELKRMTYLSYINKN